ncbi:MAG: thioredoxin family protein [Clostridia bacterium]|nr:thioredoxin family protein [Clostridia bacterium]
MRRLCALLLAISVFLFTLNSCKSNSSVEHNTPPVIGDISYSSPIFLMSLETIEGEEEPGIVYREVLDFNNLITSDKTIILYFFTTANSDLSGITAGVEDMAQYYGDSILFVGVDCSQRKDITTAYGVVALPEFVYIRNNVLVSYFEGYKYDYWEIEDVMNWIEEMK